MKMVLNRQLLVVITSLAFFTAEALAQEKQAAETPPAEPTPEVSEAQTEATTTPDQSTPSKTKKLYKELMLSKEQKKQILEVKKSSKTTIAGAKEAIKAAKSAYQEVFDKVGSDQELSDKFQSLQTARQTLADARFQQMLKIRAILNEEQKKKFHELKAGLRKK